MRDQRSGCPINLTVEALGDRWSLIILRDIMFGRRRSYRDLLDHSLEGIATNILASRLEKLVAEGLLTKASDPNHKQRTIYSLTEAAIDLVPVMVQLGAWGRKHQPASPDLAARSELLEDGGPTMWRRFMDELRHLHLGTPNKRRASVLEQLDQAYERAREGPKRR